MKKIYIIMFFLAGAAVLLAGSSLIQSFTAASDGKVITLTWKTTAESDISSFSIERMSPNQSYAGIKTINPNGYASTYTYNDRDAYSIEKNGSSPQVNTKFTYRIKIFKKDGTSDYSDEVNATQSLNNFHRTWGMIKEMFR
ncbi:MAG: hypothetical protein QG635_650 [Bacteroidota bacterium]|nr:hypothetical protein [Bacteroidota bacterium]